MKMYIQGFISFNAVPKVQSSAQEEGLKTESLWEAAER